MRKFYRERENMKQKRVFKFVKNLANTPFSKVLKVINEIIAFSQAIVLNIIWYICGNKKVNYRGSARGS